MAYFIFQKNLDNIEGTLYRIAENQEDFNNLNINDDDYKIIEDSSENFNFVKLNQKNAIKYNQNTIIYINIVSSFKSSKDLNSYIDSLKNLIKDFLNNNPNNSAYNKWNNYLNQLTSLNTSSITYPLNKSLEQYFNDLGQPSLNILQIP